MILFKKCAVAFFFLFFLHGISIGTRQQGISYNVMQIGDVKALQNVSGLVECWWLLYCLCAVIGCPSFGMIINNLNK